MTETTAKKDVPGAGQPGTTNASSANKESSASGAALRPAVTGHSNADMAADAAPGPRVDGEDLKARQDQLLEEAIEETFPASDPISPKQIT